MNQPRLEIVFAYRQYSAQPGQAGHWEMARFKATREAIEALEGQLVDGTAEEVPASELDDKGRYLLR
jgi:hypothetical protein